MNRKYNRMQILKPKTAHGQRSAFEMSLSLEFQTNTRPKAVAKPKAGELCPNCQSAKIDYDGMLNLSCPHCDYTLAGCFT